MAGIGIIIPGTGPGTGPIVPNPLPSAGVEGYTHRYSGVRLAGANGATITSWLDSGASPAAMAKTGSGAATIKDGDEAFRYLRLTDAAAMSAAIAGARPGTFCLVVRKVTNSQRVFNHLGVQVTKAGTGAYQVSGYGTGAAGAITTTLITTGWACIVATIKDASQAVRANGTTTTGAVTPGTPQAATIAALAAGQTTDVAELIIWDGVDMSDAQRLAVYTAMQAAYPTMAL